jgi:hypothetical protein
MLAPFLNYFGHQFLKHYHSVDATFIHILKEVFSNKILAYQARHPELKTIVLQNK